MEIVGKCSKRIQGERLRTMKDRNAMGGMDLLVLLYIHGIHPF